MQTEKVTVHVYISKLRQLLYQIARNLIEKTHLDNSNLNDINFAEHNLSLDKIYCGVKVEQYVLDEHFSMDARQRVMINIRNYYIKFCQTFAKKIDLII